MRKVATTLIWICLSLRTDHLVHILREVGKLEKATIQDTSTLQEHKSTQISWLILKCSTDMQLVLYINKLDM